MGKQPNAILAQISLKKSMDQVVSGIACDPRFTLTPVWARVFRGTALGGAQPAVAEASAAGGVNSRMHEAVQRDRSGNPDEASRRVRDLDNNQGCEIILNAEATGASFAVNDVAHDIENYVISRI